MFPIATHLNFIHFKQRYLYLPFQFVFMSNKLYSINTHTHAVMRKIRLHAFRVAGTYFRVAGEMRRLPAYFDNPAKTKKRQSQYIKTLEEPIQKFRTKELRSSSCIALSSHQTQIFLFGTEIHHGESSAYKLMLQLSTVTKDSTVNLTMQNCDSTVQFIHRAKLSR